MQHLTLRGIFKCLEYQAPGKKIHYMREGQSESPGSSRCFNCIFLCFCFKFCFVFLLKNQFTCLQKYVHTDEKAPELLLSVTMMSSRNILSSEAIIKMG